MGRSVVSHTRVRYADTDQMGIAHHANYIIWFEIGRTDLIRDSGITYRSIEERGLMLVVVEVACRYRSPFTYDEEVLIRTSIGEAASRSVTFNYELLDAEEKALRASGFSRHIWVDRATRRPVKAPDDLIELFEHLQGDS